MAEMPNDVGGDTIFACAYEMYDRMSPYWQKLCDGLTATHFQVSLIYYLLSQLFTFSHY